MTSRKIPEVFDFEKQQYLLEDGTVSTEYGDFHFPCPRCKGPSDIVMTVVHPERYGCLNCNHEFNVD